MGVCVSVLVLVLVGERGGGVSFRRLLALLFVLFWVVLRGSWCRSVQCVEHGSVDLERQRCSVV